MAFAGVETKFSTGHAIDWIPRFRQAGLTRFDPRTENFQTWTDLPGYDNDDLIETAKKEFKEWPVPTPWVGPYPAKKNKNADGWTAEMSTDLILRLDPRTGKFTEYVLPTVNANIRHIDMDNSKSSLQFGLQRSTRARPRKLNPWTDFFPASRT
jgi:hypothetical protein